MSSTTYIIVGIAAAIVIAACALHTHEVHHLLMQWLPALHGGH